MTSTEKKVWTNSRWDRKFENNEQQSNEIKLSNKKRKEKKFYRVEEHECVPWRSANIWKCKKNNKVVGSDECSISRVNVIQLEVFFRKIQANRNRWYGLWQLLVRINITVSGLNWYWSRGKWNISGHILHSAYVHLSRSWQILKDRRSSPAGGQYLLQYTYRASTIFFFLSRSWINPSSHCVL